LAPGIAAPDGSTTVPERLPTACPKTLAANNTGNSKRRVVFGIDLAAAIEKMNILLAFVIPDSSTQNPNGY
jgi:hypothetical protein